jgi:hypothetical protein
MAHELLPPALALVLVAVLGCSASTRPCTTSDVCKGQHVCITGQCRPNAPLLTEAGARRVVLEPEQLALICSGAQAPWTGVDIPLGRSSLGQQVLLMRFAPVLSETSRLVAAVLVLEAMPGVPPSTSPVPITVARIVEPWNAQEANWSRLPALSAGEVRAWASTWGGQTMQLDVTAVVSRWGQRRADDRGLALIAGPTDAVGASYSLGLAGGRRPRLELYLR